MRKLIDGSPEDIGRGKLAQRNRRRIVCCIKRFACRAQLVLLAFIICVVTPAGRSSLDRKLFTVALAQKPATEKSDAQKSFELMKTLAGNWKGPVTMVPQMPVEFEPLVLETVKTWLQQQTRPSASAQTGKQAAGA